jgi:radical SAM superfamily enzyme YgiQ (UPF0313 family)
MLGNKGETRETVRKTIEFAKELDPDTAQFFPLMVYPGTEAFKWAKENGFLKTTDWSQWLKSDGTHNTIVSTPELSAEELVRLCNRARIEFYLRPKYVFKKLSQMFSNPREIPRILKSSIVFTKYLFKELKEEIRFRASIN